MTDETKAGRAAPKRRTKRRSAQAAGPAGILPLEAEVIPRNGGWSIFLPVRADHFALNKVTVIRERVVVRRGEVVETVRVSERVQKELPRVEQHGELAADVEVEGGDSTLPAPPSESRRGRSRRSD